MAIEFTQYLLPHGRTKSVSIARPEHIEDKANTIINAGYCFECEVLRTGQVSLTIADPEKGIDVDIRVVANNDDVPEAVDSLVQDFSA